MAHGEVSPSPPRVMNRWPALRRCHELVEHGMPSCWQASDRQGKAGIVAKDLHAMRVYPQVGVRAMRHQQAEACWMPAWCEPLHLSRQTRAMFARQGPANGTQGFPCPCMTRQRRPAVFADTMRQFRGREMVIATIEDGRDDTVVERKQCAVASVARPRCIPVADRGAHCPRTAPCQITQHIGVMDALPMDDSPTGFAHELAG